MRAVWMERFGPPEVLVAGEAPEPAAGDGQVVVDVAYANITFVETRFRSSGFGPFRPDLPVIPGNGVGGTVTGVGAGVEPALVGQRVVATTGGSGGYAERAAVDTSAVVAVPDAVSLDDAVALLADGRTALWLAGAAAVRAGERVLVTAAAGGVGTLLLQHLAALGATVVGAAGGDRKVAVARDLGAAVAVDYRSAGWTDAVVTAAGGVDVVLDGVGGDVARAAVDLLVPGGRLLTFGAASGDWAGLSDDEAADRSVVVVRPERPGGAEQVALTARALDDAAAGAWHPVIGQRFPLERAADAHAAIESRSSVGKTLLAVR